MFNLNLKNMKKLTLGILILSLVLASFVSAKTLVSGITYNSNFNAIIAGASVRVECLGGLTKDTISLNDGIYGVAFDVNECSETSTIKVSASKGNLAGNAQGGIVSCNDDSCDSTYLSIVNVVLREQPQPPTGGGGGRGGGLFYLCGNGVCNSGENNNLCPQDCKLIENENQEIPLSTGTSETGQEAEEGKGNAGITGAVIGGGVVSMIIPIIFILAIILISVIVFVIRKRRISC